MTFEIFLSLMLFAVVGTLTPGPNNIMLLAAGMNFGYLRTVPHMLGVGLGFPVLVIFVGLGLSQLFDYFPFSYVILKLVSSVYLFFLAWKIATAAKPDLDVGVGGTPLTFVQAAGFQWVNPKAWTMSLSAISLYGASDVSFGQSFYSISLVALAFLLAAILSTNVWTLLGDKMRQFIMDDKKLRIFNVLCGGALVASLIPMLMI